MTITLQPKPYDIEVDITGFGIFKLHRFSAVVEMELNAKNAEISKRYKDFEQNYSETLDKEKGLIANGDETALASFRKTQEFIECQTTLRKITESLQELDDLTNKQILSCFEGDKKLIDKLFNTLTVSQLKDLYLSAIKEANQNA